MWHGSRLIGLLNTAVMKHNNVHDGCVYAVCINGCTPIHFVRLTRRDGQMEVLIVPVLGDRRIQTTGVRILAESNQIIKN